MLLEQNSHIPFKGNEIPGDQRDLVFKCLLWLCFSGRTTASYISYGSLRSLDLFSHHFSCAAINAPLKHLKCASLLIRILCSAEHWSNNLTVEREITHAKTSISTYTSLDLTACKITTP